MRWLIYGLGGGLGHLTRSLAFARAAEQRGHEVRVLSNSPLALTVQTPDVVTVIEPTYRADQTREVVRELLATIPHDCLIVDTFPRGLGGELVEYLTNRTTTAIWVQRHICADYLERFDIARFVTTFDGVVAPGDPVLLESHRSTEPWLSAEPDECLERMEARWTLGLDPHCFAVLVSPSGTAEEAAMLRSLASQLRTEMPETTVFVADRYPMFPLMRAFDCVVGGGGYNLTWEAKALGIPHVAFAFPRLYDRQRARLAHATVVQAPAQAIAACRALPTAPAIRTSRTFVNGAADGVLFVEEVARKRGYVSLAPSNSNAG